MISANPPNPHTHAWSSFSLVVAQNLGHADTRMVEKHYGHLARSYVADTIRKTAPSFGVATDRNVVPLLRRLSHSDNR